MTATLSVPDFYRIAITGSSRGRGRSDMHPVLRCARENDVAVQITKKPCRRSSHGSITLKWPFKYGSVSSSLTACERSHLYAAWRVSRTGDCTYGLVLRNYSRLESRRWSLFANVQTVLRRGRERSFCVQTTSCSS